MFPFKVKLLFEANIALDEANKRLLCLLEKEQKHRSERKHSASNSTKVKSTNQPTIKLTHIELLVATMNSAGLGTVMSSVGLLLKNPNKTTAV